MRAAWIAIHQSHSTYEDDVSLAGSLLERSVPHGAEVYTKRL